MRIKCKLILFIFILFFLSCKSTTSNVTPEQNKKEEPITLPVTLQEEQFQEDQPKYPSENDDPFFLIQDNKIPNEAFRVLVTKNNYSVRQIEFENNMERVKDVNGDKEQFNTYKQIYDQINFKDWEFEGVITVYLNPQTANIEKIQYYSRYIPKMKQAVELFIQDISRYKFQYLTDTTYPKEFNIRILWRINKDPSLTEEQAKQRAIEYLRKYVR